MRQQSVSYAYCCRSSVTDLNTINIEPDVLAVIGSHDVMPGPIPYARADTRRMYVTVEGIKDIEV